MLIVKEQNEKIKYQKTINFVFIKKEKEQYFY
jgi:hypothetical protein